MLPDNLVDAGFPARVHSTRHDLFKTITNVLRRLINVVAHHAKKVKALSIGPKQRMVHDLGNLGPSIKGEEKSQEGTYWGLPYLRVVVDHAANQVLRQRTKRRSHGGWLAVFDVDIGVIPTSCDISRRESI